MKDDEYVQVKRRGVRMVGPILEMMTTNEENMMAKVAWWSLG